MTKTTAQHTPIPEDGKRHPAPAGASTRTEQASPLHTALAAVSSYGDQGPGVDLETYLAAVDAGRSHQDALTIAKTSFEGCVA